MSASIRRATGTDVDSLTELRHAFVTEFDSLPDDDEHRRSVSAYLARALASGDFVAWVAEVEGQTVSTGGMVVYERMMRSGSAGVGYEGYVLNVYTLPLHRRCGYARLVMEALLAHAKANGIRLTLLATDDGRPLYEGLGFAPDARTYRWWP